MCGRFPCVSFAVLAVMVCWPAGEARSSPIEIVQTGTGSGTVGKVAFTNRSFTLTSFSDTSTRVAVNFGGGTGYILFNDSSFASIDGVGEFQILSPTTYFVNNTAQLAGYSYNQTPSPFPFPTNQYALFYSPHDAAFGTWDMTESVGPLSGTGQLLQWTDNTVQSTGGVIAFQSADTASTFQAIVGTPEPAGLPFLLAAAALLRRVR